MSETVVDIRIPEPLLRYGYRAEDIQRRVTEWLVLSLFTEGRISTGKAASLLGMPRVEFIALLRRRGIAFIDYSPGELNEEFQAVDSLEVHQP